MKAKFYFLLVRFWSTVEHFAQYLAIQATYYRKNAMINAIYAVKGNPSEESLKMLADYIKKSH